MITGSSGDELVISMGGADTGTLNNNWVTLGGSKGTVISATENGIDEYYMGYLIIT